MLNKMLNKREIKKKASQIKRNINSRYPNLSQAYSKTKIGNPVLVRNWNQVQNSFYYIVPILKNNNMIGAMTLDTINGFVNSIGILGTPIPCFFRKLTKGEEYIWTSCQQTKSMWFPLIYKKENGKVTFEDYKGIKYSKLTYAVGGRRGVLYEGR